MSPSKLSASPSDLVDAGGASGTRAAQRALSLSTHASLEEEGPPPAEKQVQVRQLKGKLGALKALVTGEIPARCSPPSRLSPMPSNVCAEGVTQSRRAFRNGAL